MNVSATDSTRSPETPKSHNLTTPCLVKRIFDGLISVQNEGIRQRKASYDGANRTSMDDTVRMEVIKSVKDARSDLAHDLFAHASELHLANAPRDTVEASSLTKLHEETYL